MGPTSREDLPQNEQVVTRRPRKPPGGICDPDPPTGGLDPLPLPPPPPLPGRFVLAIDLCPSWFLSRLRMSKRKQGTAPGLRVGAQHRLTCGCYRTAPGGDLTLCARVRRAWQSRPARSAAGTCPSYSSAPLKGK